MCLQLSRTPHWVLHYWGGGGESNPAVLLNLHMHTTATPAPKSKRKRSKSSAMDKAFENFMTFQRESEDKFMKVEEERWKREMEYEDRRREDREHEMRMMQMFMHHSGPPFDPPINPYEDLDYSEY